MTALLRRSDADETRMLSRIGAGVAVFLAVAVAVHLFADPFGGTPKNVISVAIETPYVGQGVAVGTPLIIHGVKVGEVTALASAPDGGVRLNADLQSGSTTGLTDAMGIDFRPANYFGVTGMNLIPGDGGQPLRSGADISLTPKGNFALQALLYRLGELSNQVITQRLINVVERATRYTDALNPLLETMIIVSTSVTDVQTVGTEQLLRNATGTSVALPGFIDALVDTGDRYLKTKIGIKGSFNADEDLKSNPYVSTYDQAQRAYYDSARKMLESDPDKITYGRYKEWLGGAETDLFSKVGKLLSSHVYELFPVVDEIRVMSDVVPRLVSPVDIGDTLRELRTRIEHMYAGTGDQRALQVRVILDALPGQAGPLQLALGAAG